MLGPYHAYIKSRGTGAPKCQQMQTSSQWRHMYNKGKQFENQFFIYGPKCKKKYILGLFWGPWGGLQWSDWAYLAFQLSSHPYLCTCEIRKQSDKKLLNLKPKIWRKKILFSCLGGPGGALCRSQVNENFRAVRPHNRADKFITREKKSPVFHIWAPMWKKCAFLAIRGAWVAHR